MNVDEAQRNRVAEWVAQGLKLSEIQSRLASELGLRMTYMEVRMLVDDLKLVPKDPEPPKAAPSLNVGPATPAERSGPDTNVANVPSDSGTPKLGKVAVSVDQIARPGAVVSGSVTFTDGQKAQWYFDQTGRLALASSQQGYRPPASDLQEFQAALDVELSKMGF